MKTETLAAIRTKAEALSGQSLGEQGDLLVEMAVQRACAHCQREDIPPEMEQAVAALALAMEEGGGTVKSLQRGDTSIAYDARDPMTLLEPFRRLATPGEV